MFDHLGRSVARRPWIYVGVWLALTAAGFALAVLGVHGENLFQRLHSGAPTVPGSQSERAEQILAETAGSSGSLTLVVEGVSPQTPGLADALAPAHADLTTIPGVQSVIDPFVLPDGPASAAAAPLIARDGDGFLVVVDLAPDLGSDAVGTALGAVETRLRAVPTDLRAVAPDASGIVGGTTLIVDEIVDQVERDLATGEAISLPVALLVMVLVFGGFLAAGMPLAGAIASIAGGLAALLGYSYLIDLDSSVVNVVTLLGLGLSIDYGLLIVSRFREELHALLDEDGGAGVRRRRRGDGAVQTAVRRTLSTAGRTVTFSALTVSIAIAGLIIFRPDILRAFGAAGVAVVLIAVATALTLVPALLTLAGRRLIRPGPLSRVPGIRWVLARTGDVQAEEGAFSRLAARVQRRPWTVMLGVLALLGVLATPVAHLDLRNSTTELLPSGSEQGDYVAAIAGNYPGASTPAVTVVAETTLEQATTWAQTLGTLDAVASVDAPSVRGSYVAIGVRPDTDDPGGPIARDVVRELRDLDPGFPVWVSGQAANQVDFVHALVERGPWAIALVVVATFVLLFLMTGSVLVPLKALIVNAMSLAASMGVLVWVFQDGHLSGLLGFTSAGGIETYVIALVLAFGFGLAMDYEVFLISRIKELYDAGASNDDAVRLGLQRSGRIITSAAAIIIVVFAGFVFGKLLVIKEVGFSLAVAVLVDATLVRLLLVPATMTLLGRWNWWAPAPLRRLYGRLHLTHG